MAGPNITWQSATLAVRTGGSEIPAWTDVVEAKSLEQFSAWIEAHLEALEAQYAGDTTPTSLARDLACGRVLQ